MSTFALAEGLESLLVAQLGFTTFHDESKTRIDGLGILLAFLADGDGGGHLFLPIASRQKNL